MPALNSAEAEVEHWANSEEAAACFVHSDRVDQRAVTAAAMCLSLQSIWERQLRLYLVTCAHSIAPDADLSSKIQRATWEDLKSLFKRLRGVPLTAFLCFPELDLLAALGNVCRHGDGPAATKLWASHPELWPEYCPRIPGERPVPSAASMNISTSMLAKRTAAIAAFWDMVEYLYNESIKTKHSSLEKRLVEQRQRLAPGISHFNQVAEKANA
jgi:hypothetical protein